MSNIVKFLEKVGQDCDLRAAKTHAWQAALDQQVLSPELRQALLNRDQSALTTLLGARSNVVCAVFPAREPEPNDVPVEEPQGPVLRALLRAQKAS